MKKQSFYSLILFFLSILLLLSSCNSHPVEGPETSSETIDRFIESDPIDSETDPSGSETEPPASATEPSESETAPTISETEPAGSDTEPPTSETTSPETDPPETTPPESSEPDFEYNTFFGFDYDMAYTKLPFGDRKQLVYINKSPGNGFYGISDYDGGIVRSKAGLDRWVNYGSEGDQQLDVDSYIEGLPSMREFAASYEDAYFEEHYLFQLCVHLGGRESGGNGKTEGIVGEPPEINAIYVQNGKLWVDVGEITCTSPYESIFIAYYEIDKALVDALELEAYYLYVLHEEEVRGEAPGYGASGNDLTFHADREYERIAVEEQKTAYANKGENSRYYGYSAYSVSLLESYADLEEFFNYVNNPRGVRLEVDSFVQGLPSLRALHESYDEAFFADHVLLKIEYHMPGGSYGGKNKTAGVEGMSPELNGIYVQDGRLWVDVGEITCTSPYDSLYVVYYTIEKSELQDLSFDRECIRLLHEHTVSGERP